MTPEIIAIDRPEGTRFTLQVLPAADPAAPALLLQPAMGVKASYYEKLAAALHQAGFHVIVSELRGHEEHGGRRPGRDYDFGYHEMLTEDWPLAVQATKTRFPQAPLYLFGHSLGGQISMLYAGQHADQLAGLVLVAISSVHWRLWGFAFLLYSQTTVLVSALLGHFPGKVFKFAGREARSVIADWARQARTGDFRLGRPQVNHREALARVTLPVLAVSLQGDFFAPKHAADDLVAKMPQAQLTRLHLDPKAMGIDGVDHFRWARKPDVVLPVIVDWLKGREARG